MKKERVLVLPADADAQKVYYLLPHDGNTSFYSERTNRNIGWITEEEQHLLRRMTVGIAGTGGMGGQVAATLLRLGIGHIKIADTEEFDISNINRQFGANITTVGKSKAFETAKMLRDIANDTIIEVYPMGITPESVVDFVKECDIICDEIEFFAIGSRILLHRTASLSGISLFNSPTVGHRSYVFKFTPSSLQIEDVLQITYGEAVILQQKIQSGTATKSEMEKVVNIMATFAAPEIPEYSSDTSIYSTVAEIKRRLIEEGKASIIATNPPMASGILANQVLFHLLERAKIKRTFKCVPAMPGYIFYDAAFNESGVSDKKWW